MLEAEYLRQQAETCSQLSRATFDLGLAGRLRLLADEFRRKAAEIERGDRDGGKGGSNRADAHRT